MTMTKANLIDSICDQVGLPKTISARLIESLLEIVKRSLERGDDVLVSGFGKFCVKEKGKRRGRNPQTGEDLTLSERKVVTFKCSRVLREKINRNQ